MHKRAELHRLLTPILLGLIVALQLLQMCLLSGGLAQDPVRDTPLSIQSSAWSGRYAVFTTLAEAAPGATLLVDERTFGFQFSPLYLRAIGGAASVEVIDLGRISRPDEGRSVTGSVRWDWRLTLDPRRTERTPDVLVIGRGERRREIIEGSLIPALVADHPVDSGTRPWYAPAIAPIAGISLAVAVETSLLLGLLLLGGLLLPTGLARGWIRQPVALLSGISLVAAAGLLHLPGLFIPAAAIAAAMLVRRALRARKIVVGWGHDDYRRIGVSAVVIAAASTLVRRTGLLVVTVDSFDYWATAHALAGGYLSVADLDMKRPAGLASLHAIGITMGVEGLLSLGLVILIASAGLLVALPSALGREGRLQTLIAVMIALVAITSAQLLTFAVYMNTHIVVAGILLLVSTLWLLQVTERLPDHSAAPAVIAAIVAITMLRAEALLLTTVVLLGTFAAARPDREGARVPWGWAWAVAGASSVAWGATYILTNRASAPALVVAAGGLVLLGVPVVFRRVPERHLPIVPGAFASALWTVTALLLVTPLGENVVFVEMARTNLWRGAGGWGVTAPIVLALGVGAAIAARGEGAAVARWMVVGFIPVALLSKLADGADRLDGVSGLRDVLLVGGGRIGWGDSVNRMWSHIVLVVLLLALLALLDPPAGRLRLRPALAGVMLVGLVALSELTHWQSSVEAPNSVLGQREAIWDGTGTLRAAAAWTARTAVRTGPPLIAGALLLTLTAQALRTGRDSRESGVREPVVGRADPSD